MNGKCYWCAAEATSDDHVPAKCFYPVAMRSNLIKVPSCTKHNTELSKLDERFRHYIQASSKSPIAVQEFGGATMRSLKRPEASGYRDSMVKGLRPALLDGQPTAAQAVDASTLHLFFEKVTRGLFFHHTGSCLRGRVSSECTHITGPGQDLRPVIAIFDEMSPHLKDGDVTHPDVFKYRYGVVTENGRHGFAVVGTFYGDVSFFGIGIEEPDAAVVN